MKLNLFLLFCVVSFLVSCESESTKSNKNMANLQAPRAKKIEHKDTTHGDVRVDNYFWLREKENEEVIAYLKAENEYTNGMTRHLEGMQDKLYDEMVARINEDDLSVPAKDGDYFYYSRTEKGKNYSIYCRKKGSLDAEEEIILDGNVLAEGKKYFRIGAYEISDDHNMLAYAIDTDGSEYYDVFFKNLVTGETLSETIEKTGGGITWANDNKTIFFNKLDDAHRSFQLWRFKLGSDKENELVYQEDDERFFVYAYKTKSSAYIVLYLYSSVTNEMHVLDANQPDGDFKIFAPRKQNVEYSINHHGDQFYILTNEDALNFKLLSTSVDNIERSNWKEVLPHSTEVLLSSVEAFKNYLVVYGRKDGYKNIQVFDYSKKEWYDVDFPEPVYTYWGSENPEYNSESFRITYSSLVTPRTVFDFNMNSKTFEKKKVYEVKGGFDYSAYTVERILAKGEDGTMIPMSIAYKKGMKKDGSSPCYLYSYGSYGSSSEPYFSTVRLSLLERGFVYAVAHIRGGSEMGRQWYEDGKYLNKKNTFKDFIACAQHLVDNKYTSAENMAINGGSAGGLLMGAVTNMRPDLFNTVVADVPFVDVINTMLDETIPLTVTEYEEWGNPNDKEYYEYMKSYSPYDNVEAKDYPNMLITAGLNDPRVQYWEPAKWTAKLRELKTDDNKLILKTNMGAGHGGASGRYEQLKEVAFEYAYIFDNLGVSEEIKD